MKKTFIFYLGLCAAGVMQAQETQDEKRIWVSEWQYYTSSVNNNGEAIGFVDQCSPYEIWIPQMGERIEIGGISAGNGIGGLGSFSDDGRLVSGVRYNENVKTEAAWQTYSLEDNTYRINNIVSPTATDMLAIGSSADGQTSVVLQSTNQGKTWKIPSLGVVNLNTTEADQQLLGGLECICCLNFGKGFAGGQNGVMYNLKPGNLSFTQIDIHPEGNTDEVKTFWAIDFLDIEYVEYTKNYGVFGLELADGTGKVWYTEDNTTTFHEATGVDGIPVSITHNGNDYFMTTRNGVIQKSSDYGKTWQTVYQLGGGISWSLDNGSPMEEIRFSDSDNGIVTGVGCIYVTADGGATWTKKEIKAANSLTVWNDVAFADGKIIIVGSNGTVCQSEDGGDRWSIVNFEEPISNELNCIIATSNSINIGATQSTLLRKEAAAVGHAYNASIYDTESETWTDLENAGYFSRLGDADPMELGVASHAYGISGDGNVVVGGVYTYEKINEQSSTHNEAAAWVNGKLVKLGSKFADRNRASMAYKSSFDGSVIVGWQDILGPWFGQLWTKNSTGGYDRIMTFNDANMKEEDITEYPTGGQEAFDFYKERMLGMCNAVTSDGKWIGGRGGSVNDAAEGAWIRNIETGETKIVCSGDNMVYDMTNDASIVVGQVGPGASSWIWTEETGSMNINSYATDVLGIDLGEFYICGIIDMSPNGRYITGWGMKGMGKYAYVLDLNDNGTNSIDKAEQQVKAAVYPNPVADELHIDLPFDEVTTRISLYDMQGAMVKTMTVNSQSNIMNVSDVHPGLYILNVNANGTKKSFKLQIKH